MTSLEGVLTIEVFQRGECQRHLGFLVMLLRNRFCFYSVFMHVMRASSLLAAQIHDYCILPSLVLHIMLHIFFVLQIIRLFLLPLFLLLIAACCMHLLLQFLYKWNFSCNFLVYIELYYI